MQLDADRKIADSRLRGEVHLGCQRAGIREIDDQSLDTIGIPPQIDHAIVGRLQAAQDASAWSTTNAGIAAVYAGDG